MNQTVARGWSSKAAAFFMSHNIFCHTLLLVSKRRLVGTLHACQAFPVIVHRLSLLAYLASLLIFVLISWMTGLGAELAPTDYFLTSKRVFLAEGDALRQFRWSERLHVSFASEHRETAASTTLRKRASSRLLASCSAKAP